MSVEDQNKSKCFANPASKTRIWRFVSLTCRSFVCKVETNLRVTSNTKQELVTGYYLYFNSSHSFSSL